MPSKTNGRIEYFQSKFEMCSVLTCEDLHKDAPSIDENFLFDVRT